MTHYTNPGITETVTVESRPAIGASYGFVLWGWYATKSEKTGRVYRLKSPVYGGKRFFSTVDGIRKYHETEDEARADFYAVSGPDTRHNPYTVARWEYANNNRTNQD